MRRARLFVLSDIQSLTEVNYYMSSLYNHLHPIVNEKGVQFLACFSSSYILVQNKLEYIGSFQLVVVMNLIIKGHSNKALANIIYISLEDQYPRISKTSQQALLKLLYFHDGSKVIHTSNQKLQMLFSCGKRRVQQITYELTHYSIIDKDQPSCDCENTLCFSINIPNISGIKFKQTEFLATYVKTDTLHARGMVFKVAVFKDVHDVDNLITIKSDRVSYDDETSDFLKKLNAGDIISYTPSINKPTIKGIKHPLNLKIHTKAETEDDMTFFGEFEHIQEKTHEKFGLSRCAWFTHIANTDFSIKTPITSVSLKPNCLNSQALERIEKGDLIVFKARVSRITTNEGKEVLSLKDIYNIMSRDEYYDNYGAM